MPGFHLKEYRKSCAKESISQALCPPKAIKPLITSTCEVRFRAADIGTSHDGWRSLARLPGAGELRLNYDGHTVRDLSKNPCFSPAHRVFWRCCNKLASLAWILPARDFYWPMSAPTLVGQIFWLRRPQAKPRPHLDLSFDTCSSQGLVIKYFR